MRIKARLAPMSCPESYWLKTTEIDVPDDIPIELIGEIIDLWENLKTGKAKTIEDKKKMIEIYNLIYNTSYNPGTNCGSCINTAYEGIKKIYKENNPFI